ncbi:MAG: SPOR domain-containing protein [Rickettsiales bacterium]|jgi:cell division septation protein DedD|nr:SPOR domain-containing protein [Rickettsiales bacterium]
MSDNPNDFFTQAKPESFEEESSSASGIAYGDGDEAKAASTSTRMVIIAVAVGAVFAGLLMILLMSGRKPEPTNAADIPMLSASGEPIKFAPDSEGGESAIESASIYGSPVDFDEDAKRLLGKTESRPEPLPPLPVKVVRKPAVKKPASPVAAKKPAAKPGPEYQIVEQSTSIKSEAEMVDRAVFGTPASSAGGAWHVQLASSSAESAARAEWQSLSKKYPQLLGNRTHTIQTAAVGGRTYYRLRVSGLATSADASELCAKLKAYGVACFVTK